RPRSRSSGPRRRWCGRGRSPVGPWGLALATRPGLAAGPAAQVEHGAASAGRPARVADPPAVEDEEVGGTRPALAGHEGHELGLDLDGIVALRETEAVRHPQDVGVDRDPLVHAVGMAQDHVRRLAPDPGQLDHGREVAGYAAPVTLQEAAD